LALPQCLAIVEVVDDRCPTALSSLMHVFGRPISQRLVWTRAVVEDKVLRQSQRIRLDRPSAASDDLNRLLDEPGIVALWGIENSFREVEGAPGSEADEDPAGRWLWLAIAANVAVEAA
jgi:hypothetical protein